METDNLRCGRRESLNDCSDVCVREKEAEKSSVCVVFLSTKALFYAECYDYRRARKCILSIQHVGKGAIKSTNQ